MQARIVEEIPLDTPGLVIHLFPLGFWVAIDLHLIGLQGARAWTDRSTCSRYSPSRALAVKGFLPVSRDNEASDTRDNLLGFARRQVKLVDRLGTTAKA